MGSILFFSFFALSLVRSDFAVSVSAKTSIPLLRRGVLAAVAHSACELFAALVLAQGLWLLAAGEGQGHAL